MSTASVLDQELFPWTDPGFRAEPWPYYQRILRDHPVHQLENGTWVISRYDDVMNFAKLPSMHIVFSSSAVGNPWGALSNSVLLTEPPRHTQLRRSFSRWFTPKLVRRWTETTASKAREALDSIGPDGIIDAHRELATQPNHAAMTTALGIPEDDSSPVIRAMNMTLLSAAEGPSDDDMTRSQEAISYLMHRAEQIIEAKQSDRGDGMLLDELLQGVDDGTLTMREVKETVWLLWGSGGHNPGYIVDAGLITFAEQPEIFEAYKRQPEVREAIVNEVIRLNAPEATIERVCSEPVEIQGVKIPADSVFKFMLAAANRDPAVFSNPDEFDYTRPKEASMNLSFGLGTHNCAGQVLSRAETRTVFDVVAERYDRVEVIGDPDYVSSDRARNIEGLTVRLT